MRHKPFKNRRQYRNVSFLSTATPSLWDSRNASVHLLSPFSFCPFFTIPFAQRFAAPPLPPPPLLALPLGAPLTSTSTPAGEDEGGRARRRVRRGRQQRRGHTRARKHPCLACSPDTRERRASQRCCDPPATRHLNHPLP